MTTDHLLVLGILAGAMALFVTDRLRVDLVALMVLAALVLTGLLTPAEAFAGFASPAVVTVWAVFIISGALFRSGVADILARLMLRLAGHSPTRLLLVMMGMVGGMSAFMNNIGAVAILLPAVLTIARDLRITPSKLLIPLAFAALLGGNMTLVGTPPNILAATILESYSEVPPLRFFDFLPTGVLVLSAGIAYMLLVGRHLLPERLPGGDVTGGYPVRNYLTEVQVGEGSPLIGGTLSDSRFGERYDLTILQVNRGAEGILSSGSEQPLAVGDVLLISGPLDKLLTIARSFDLHLIGEWGGDGPRPSLPHGRAQLAEVTLGPRSHLSGLTVREMAFRTRYGVSVLGIRQAGETRSAKLANCRVRFGDALLLQGPIEKINLLRNNPDFLVLDLPPFDLRRLDKAPLAVAILAAALFIVTLGWMDIAVTLLIVCVLLVLTRVLTMDEAYESIDWKAVFLIAGMLPLGTAMETTGTAQLLADQLVMLVGDVGPLAVLAAMFVTTALLTEVISNAAATVLMVPIAIDAAGQIGADPRPFVIAAVLAASTSFLMPIGHQVNVIIYGPGGYKFTDYARIGIGLNLLLLVLAVIFVPIVWPLY